jgi:hypothetical protein
VRASAARPVAAEPIMEASNLYTRIRFAAAPPELRLLELATERLRGLKSLKARPTAS